MELPTQYQYLYGKPQVTAKIRQQPEDFQVTEIPSFEPEGDGEHVFLYIRKVGENTDWVAKQLANFAKSLLKTWVTPVKKIVMLLPSNGSVYVFR